jgi:(p)ppGpp synthase/HD superfamily hydrolase
MPNLVAPNVRSAFEALIVSAVGEKQQRFEALASAAGFSAAEFELDADSSNELVRAAIVATAVHIAQQDKAGAAYINHPKRVFKIARDLSLPAAGFEGTAFTAGLVAALLHDVIEDSAEKFGRQVSADDLLNLGFSDEAVKVVSLLSFDKTTDKNAYLRAIAVHPLALAVKLADTCDNMNKARQAAISAQKQQEFADKYGNYMTVLGFDPNTDWFANSINN